MSEATTPRYIPKQNHPWRRYRDRPRTVETPEELKLQEKLPSLHDFLKNLAECWDTYTVPKDEFSSDYVKLKSITQPRAAEWIISFMQRTWIKKETFLDGQ